MDFIVGLPEVRGCDSVYVVVDWLSKYAHFIPCSSSITAEGVARLFITHVWKLHGFPRSIITDRDLKFVSSFLARIHGMLKDRPQDDRCAQPRGRRTDRKHQPHPSEWFEFLPCAECIIQHHIQLYVALRHL